MNGQDWAASRVDIFLEITVSRAWTLMHLEHMQQDIFFLITYTTILVSPVLASSSICRIVSVVGPVSSSGLQKWKYLTHLIVKYQLCSRPECGGNQDRYNRVLHWLASSSSGGRLLMLSCPGGNKTDHEMQCLIGDLNPLKSVWLVAWEEQKEQKGQWKQAFWMLVVRLGTVDIINNPHCNHSQTFVRGVFD